MSLVMKFVLLFYLTGKIRKAHSDRKSIFNQLVHRHVIVCPTVTCDFEIDQCAWNMDATWEVFPSGSMPETASSGPISDHTSGGTVSFSASLQYCLILFESGQLRSFHRYAVESLRAIRCDEHDYISADINTVIILVLHAWNSDRNIITVGKRSSALAKE